MNANVSRKTRPRYRGNKRNKKLRGEKKSMNEEKNGRVLEEREISPTKEKSVIPRCMPSKSPTAPIVDPTRGFKTSTPLQLTCPGTGGGQMCSATAAGVPDITLRSVPRTSTASNATLLGLRSGGVLCVPKQELVRLPEISRETPARARQWREVRLRGRRSRPHK